MKIFTTALFCLATAFTTVAQEKERPALRLIEQTGFVETAIEAGEAMMKPMFEQMKAQGLPNEAIEEVKKATNRFLIKTFEHPDIVVELAEIYEKHFTHEELEELLVFYRTPLGKKTLLTMSDVMNESMAVGQKYGAKNQAEFQAEIMTIMEKYQDQPEPAPAE